MYSPFSTETHTEHGTSYLVEIYHDTDMAAPWDEFDGHGPVSGWETRAKRPGELVLNTSRGASRFYDFAQACQLAKRDGWGPRDDAQGLTKRQRSAQAAREDFAHLRDWCLDRWQYVGIVVTALSPAGERTADTASVWGVEYGMYFDRGAYLRDLIGETEASKQAPLFA